ncbi:MAG: hypothetical protein WBD38_12425 [Candidatus Dormiibacterota bacterium]
MEILEGIVLWAALLWATGSALVPRLGRWGWWIATMLLLLWLALGGRPGIALALGAGATVAQVIDRRGVAGTDFTGLLRSVMAMALGYLFAGFALVRLVHAEFAFSLRAFPALAATSVAVAVVVLAVGDREQLRAGRFLAAMGAIAWVVAGPTDQAALSYVAAAWLPLLAAAGRLRLTAAG